MLEFVTLRSKFCDTYFCVCDTHFRDLGGGAKKWNVQEFDFGGRFASFHKNDVIFGNFDCYSEKKMFFKISHLPKKRQKVP